MSLELTLRDQQALADTFQRTRSEMNERELLAAVLADLGFAIGVAGLWVLHPPHAFALLPALICVLVLALATRVRFDTALGFAVPTQVAFVPLLFATPLAFVPLAVVLAWTIARLPDILRGRTPAGRLLQVPGNSCYALGPTLVFVVANVEPVHAGAALLISALAAQCVLDFAVTSLRDAVARGANVSAQISSTPVYAIDAALCGVGLLVAEHIHDAPASVLALIPLLGLFAMFGRERHERLKGLLELNNAYRGTALVLGDVVEADDSYTGEHCRSVVELALAVADRIELSPEQRRNLEFAALLHDVGKIAIPKHILNKPGKLDPEEWTVIKTHTVEGQRMLERVGGFMREVGLIVRSHHERWDGTGYPDSLAGEAIPIEARIIAACDTWNAMRTDRVYRPALAHPVAVAELVTNTGTQFDPGVVQPLLEIVAPDEARERHGSRACAIRSGVAPAGSERVHHHRQRIRQ